MSAPVKYLLLLVVLYGCRFPAYSGISKIQVLSNGFVMYDNPLSACFLNVNDTALFILSDSSTSFQVESVEIPVDASSWIFTLDQNQSTMSIRISREGRYRFKVGTTTFGSIVCTDPNSALRFFEFKIDLYDDSENFIAATSDSYVIHVVDSLLNLPEEQRGMHIKGLIDHGNGGHNKDWNWHFVENRWRMAEFSEEVCDGWSSFVRDSVNYWVDFLGYFCPWSSKVIRETLISPTLTFPRPPSPYIYPNPSAGGFGIDGINYKQVVGIQVFNYQGVALGIYGPFTSKLSFLTPELAPGVYTVVVTTPRTFYPLKLILTE